MTAALATPGAHAGSATPLHWAERAAARHLANLGWRLLASNYRLRGGELDLVFRAGSTVVVVEVKQRKNAAYGHPGESIDRRKLSRIRGVAQHYVSYVLKEPSARLRLDAVLVLGTEERFQLQHLENVG